MEVIFFIYISGTSCCSWCTSCTVHTFVGKPAVGNGGIYRNQHGWNPDGCFDRGNRSWRENLDDHSLVLAGKNGNAAGSLFSDRVFNCKYFRERNINIRTYPDRIRAFYFSGWRNYLV